MYSGTHHAVEDTRNDHILIYINGQYHRRHEAKISVFDSGYLVGDGVWEALRLHQGALVFWEEHMDRLWAGAAAIGLSLPWTREELLSICRDCLQRNEMTDHIHMRIMVTRGIKKTPSQDPRLTISGPNLVIIPEYKKASRSTKEKGITLFTSTIRRGRPDYLDPRLNCHSKLHEEQALVQALEAGADEALMLDANGFVATCNSTNFFIVKNQKVITSTGKYCMNGITRQKVLDLCLRHNIPCEEKNFSLFEVYSADEAFVTGSFGGLTPVRKVDGREILLQNGGSLLPRLQEGYQELIKENIQKFLREHA